MQIRRPLIRISPPIIHSNHKALCQGLAVEVNDAADAAHEGYAGG